MPKYRISGLSQDTGRSTAIVVEAVNHTAAMDVARENSLIRASFEWVKPSTEITGSTWLPPRSKSTSCPVHLQNKTRFCKHCDRTCNSCTGEEDETCSLCGRPYGGDDAAHLSARLKAYRARKSGEGD